VGFLSARADQWSGREGLLRCVGIEPCADIGHTKSGIPVEPNEAAAAHPRLTGDGDAIGAWLW